MNIEDDFLDILVDGDLVVLLVLLVAVVTVMTVIMPAEGANMLKV